MENKDETKARHRKPSVQSIILLLIVAISIVLAGWALVVVSTNFQISPADFVALPNTPLSTQGSKVVFVSVAGVFSQKSLADGVKGYLMTSTGAPVAGVKVYLTYYLEGAYRTQVVTTGQNGYFEAHFPMNWTGWLPVTLIYFGDGQHQGIAQIASVSGESPY
jgi:hypothetical protein